MPRLLYGSPPLPPPPRLQAVLSPTSTTTTTSPTEKTEESSSTAVELRPPPPRAEVVIRAHEPHPDCPDTLACLPDTDGRPQHTLPVILRCTILGSPRKRLTIREIYAAMERKYPYYKTAGPAWKVRPLFASTHALFPSYFSWRMLNVCSAICEASSFPQPSVRATTSPTLRPRFWVVLDCKPRCTPWN